MKITVETEKKYQLINISALVEDAAAHSKVNNGLCLVFVAHSTAAIILTEDEPGLKKDWLKLFQKLVGNEKFEHNRIDNNADSHLLSGLLGQGKTLPVENGRLVRGAWQDIFLAELDGPRKREIIVKIIKG